MAKVHDLAGALLDYWVAKAEGVDAVMSDPHPNGSRNMVTFYSRDHDGHLGGRSYKPSEHWDDGGPIVERAKIAVETDYPTGWIATNPDADHWRGPTLLVAAMRAYVASVYGETVPDEVPA